MDKLKDEVITDQSLLRNRKDTIHAIIALALVLALLAAFFFFGPESI